MNRTMILVIAVAGMIATPAMARAPYVMLDAQLSKGCVQEKTDWVAGKAICDEIAKKLDKALFESKKDIDIRLQDVVRKRPDRENPATTITKPGLDMRGSDIKRLQFPRPSEIEILKWKKIAWRTRNALTNCVLRKPETRFPRWEKMSERFS